MKFLTKKIMCAAVSLLIATAMFSQFIILVEAIPAAPTGNVQQRIDNYLKSLFPNNSYFHVYNSACSHGTYQTCDDCKLSNVMMQRLGYSSRQGNIEAWTCVAFARYAYFYVFGNPWDTGTNPTTSTTVPSTNALPGDVFIWWTTATSGEIKHAAMYLGNDLFFHSNVNGTNKVSYGTAFTNGVLNRVVRANNYAQIDNVNTTFSGATPISLNTYEGVSVTAANQKRYYSFTPSTTGFYTIESSSNGSSDPYGWLYNPSQSQISYNDDMVSGNANFRMVYHLQSGQKYYIAAGCYSTGTGNYQIRVTSTTNLGTVSTTPAPATLTTATPGSANISASCQRRYFVFTATTARSYTFESSANGSSDPIGWVYNTSGNQLAHNDDTNGGRNFRMTVSLTAGQKVFVVAGCYGSTTGSYTVSVS
jgi:hypothetical protein